MNGIKKLQEQIGPFRNFWKSFEIRAVTVNTEDGHRVLGLRIRLNGQSASEVDHVASLTLPDGFRSWLEICPIERLTEVLSGLMSGRITLGKSVLLYGVTNRTTDDFNFEFSRGEPGYPWLGLMESTPYLAAHSIGEDFATILNSLPEWGSIPDTDWILRAGTPPFLSLGDMVASSLSIDSVPTDRDINRVMSVIVAPICLHFLDTSKIDQGLVRLDIARPSDLPVSDLAVRVIEFSNSRPVNRGSIDLSAANHTQKNFISLNVKKYQADVTDVHAYLVYKGVVVDSTLVSDNAVFSQNQRMTAYGIFDSGYSNFQRYLCGNGSDPATDHETAVAFLFHFCGFNVGYYGHVKQVQDEIDLLVFAPDGDKVFAVECTTKDIDNKNKISKFVRRVAELRTTLDHIQVIPLLFTALTTDKIPRTDIEKAKNEQILIITQSDADELFKMAVVNKTADEITRHLLELPQRKAWQEMVRGAT